MPPGRLWPNTPSGTPVEIEVFGATGEFKSGKTILGLCIAPGVHPEGHAFAGKPRTLYLDHEKSGGTYGGTGAHRVDVPAKMLEMHPRSYTPLDVFNWFLGTIDRLQGGQFDVLVVDPVTDIEAGLVQYVRKNCADFGLTANQLEKSAGLLWGAVKDYWKQILLRLSAKVRCFYFTAHLRDEWKGNTPTGRREPKGKDTLMELASLYLWLERVPDKDGKVNDAPSALVLKERLADTSINLETGEVNVVRLMPPRLPVATVQAIRRYIACPPDYAKLKDGERVTEKEASEEELLRLRLAAAEAEQATETSRLSRLTRTMELQALARQSSAEKPQASDQVGNVQKFRKEKREEAAREVAEEAAREVAETAEKDVEKDMATDGANGHASQSTIPVDAEQAAIDKLRHEAQVGMDRAREEERRLLQESPPEAILPPAVQKIKDAGAVSTAAEMAATRELATPAQVEEVRRLAGVLGIDKDKMQEIVARAGVKRVREMSREHCRVLIEKMLAKEREVGTKN